MTIWGSKIHKHLFLGSILFLISYQFLTGQEISDNLNATFYDGEIILDGVLDEEVWSRAIPITNFTQREPSVGEPATDLTKVAVVYNETEIYFGIWCHVSNADQIVAHRMARDFSWASDDNFKVIISPYHDNRNGFMFITNPNGAMADIWVGDDGRNINVDWNGVWDAAVTRNDKGWFIEIVIPFSTLSFPRQQDHVWGVNFERIKRAKNEEVLWQGWSRDFHIFNISQGGTLTGISNIKQGTTIEIRPSIVGGFEVDDNKVSYQGKLSGEINFDITPTLRANFTANTDFAQVESDRQQINLSRFSIFYPEKRQFFLEGRNYFDMHLGPAILFHSRSIGIEGDRQIPIIGGGRVFGKLDRTSLGVMSIQTAAKDEIPTTNHSVIKVQQDLFKQSNIGFMTTSKFSDNEHNMVYAGNFTYSISNLFGDKNFLAGGTIANTETVSSDTLAVMNDDNLAYSIFIRYPNDLVEFDMGMTSIGAGFNPGMGFSRRQNVNIYFSELEFQPRIAAWPFFRYFNFSVFDFRYYVNKETGEPESFYNDIVPLGFATRHGDDFYINLIQSYDRPPQDFNLINDVIIPAGSYWDNRVEIGMHSFRGRKIAADFSIGTGGFYTGTRDEIEVATYINVNKHLNLYFDWERNNVQLPGKHFITDELGGRVDYSFNPRLQTSLFGQWNSEDAELLLNYRLNWIPSIGNYFFFVINQSIDAQNRLVIERTTVLAKFIWRLAV